MTKQPTAAPLVAVFLLSRVQSYYSRPRGISQLRKCHKRLFILASSFLDHRDGFRCGCPHGKCNERSGYAFKFDGRDLHTDLAFARPLDSDELKRGNCDSRLYFWGCKHDHLAGHRIDGLHHNADGIGVRVVIIVPSGRLILHVAGIHHAGRVICPFVEHDVG